MPLALVTGGAGFVGSAVVRALLARGRQVRVLVRRSTSRENLEGLPVELAFGDVTERASLDAACKGADEVFHVAAMFKYGVDPKVLYEVNVGGARKVIEAAASAGARRIVHTSSIAAIGARTDGKPADETWTWNMGGFGEHYTESKREGELAVMALARAGAPVVVVNPSGPIGPGDRGPTGVLVRMYARGLMRFWLDQWINLVDVDSVGVGHVLAAEKGRVGERYLLSGENMHGKEIAELVLRKAGRRGPLMKVPGPVTFAGAALGSVGAKIGLQAPANLTLWSMRHFKLIFDNGKARRELGWDPGDVGRAVEKAIAWYRAKGMV